jgi:uncharacterized spore protein YtfJ
MDIPDGLKGTYDAVTVRRVYGDPIERDGVTLIPVAAVRGGFGYGGGHDDGGNEGGGGGSGVSARPVGMYRIEGGKLSWQPALDVTRIAMAGQVVAVVALLVLRSVLKSRRRRRRR